MTATVVSRPRSLRIRALVALWLSGSAAQRPRHALRRVAVVLGPVAATEGPEHRFDPEVSVPPGVVAADGRRRRRPVVVTGRWTRDHVDAVVAVSVERVALNQWVALQADIHMDAIEFVPNDSIG